MTKIDDFVKFSQEDADEYVLRLFGDDGPDPDGEWVLSMSTHTAVELFEALEKTLGRYIFEMRSTRADYDAAAGSARGDTDDGYEPSDPKHSRYLEGADAIRDAARSK